MAPLRPLNHWMLHQKKLAEEFDEILKLTPYYDPVRLVETQTDLTFLAPLTTDVNSRVGNYASDFQRNSNGLYRAPMQSNLLIAGDDVSRHEYVNGEYVGILMEQAITNICANFNANPDAAFTNMSVTVGEGTLTREDQSAKLAESGLSAVCSSGFAFKIDSPTGFTDVTIEGPTNATGTFTLSAFIYCPQGEGFLALNYIGPESTEIPFSQNTKFERISGINNAVTRTEGEWRIRVQEGTVCYFVLNQLEEAPVVSSPIITLGAAASRAKDFCKWSLTDSQGRNILNEAEGMSAILFRPGFDENALTAINEIQKILDLGINQTDFYRFQHDSGWDPPSRLYHVPVSGSTTFVSLNSPLERGEPYLIASRWSQSAANCQIGYKRSGTWYWGGVVGFAGSWTAGGTALTLSSGLQQIDFPANHSNVHIWSEDKGTAWLESFFSGVAN